MASSPLPMGGTEVTPELHGQPPVGGVTDVVRRNIDALAALRKRFQGSRDTQSRLADAITGFAGSMTSVAVHLVLFGGWILINAGVIPGIKPFDPFPFVMLAMFASVEAIFLSTFVLISQNRSALLSSKRDDLDVQVNLLTEHEITRVIEMLETLMRHQGVPLPARKELESLKSTVDPGVVIEAIERAENEKAG